VDGKLVAMDEEGRSNFNLLQNFKSAESKIHDFPFDLLVRLLISRSSASHRLQSDPYPPVMSGRYQATQNQGVLPEDFW
jgi:hypothetical protein